jgi:hypothetical protein
LFLFGVEFGCICRFFTGWFFVFLLGFWGKAGVKTWFLAGEFVVVRWWNVVRCWSLFWAKKCDTDSRFIFEEFRFGWGGVGRRFAFHPSQRTDSKGPWNSCTLGRLLPFTHLGGGLDAGYKGRRGGHWVWGDSGGEEGGSCFRRALGLIERGATACSSTVRRFCLSSRRKETLHCWMLPG